MIRVWFRTVRVIAIATAALAAQSGERRSTQPGQDATSRGVVVGPNDTLTINALNAEEISKEWRVGSAGDLSLPMAGRIHAAGKTVEQLEQAISERLRKYIRDPQVTVYVSQTLSRPVMVSGAVEKPGVIQLSGPTTLFGLLVEAGGPKTAAGRVKLTRKIENGSIAHPTARLSQDDRYMTLELPLESVMRGEGEDARVTVAPADVVTVSADEHTRMVYVTGEVNKPGGIELITLDTVSISKVLALAGGFTHTAKPSKTVIRHVNENGVETALAFIDLKKVISGKAKDLLLSDGDIMVVPSSQLLTYLQTTSQTALTTGIMILGRL